MKQKWFCEQCEVSGEVEVVDGEGVYQVYIDINDDHCEKSPECKTATVDLKLK